MSKNSTEESVLFLYKVVTLGAYFAVLLRAAYDLYSCVNLLYKNTYTQFSFSTQTQGNYIYFSTRKDYSIFRLLKMLFRLNFLVFCVMVVTDHVFVRYYICAMHTYWFLSVWVVMVVMNRYNKVCPYFVSSLSLSRLLYHVPIPIREVKQSPLDDDTKRKLPA